MSLHLLTTDEEIEYLNKVEDLLGQMDLCKRLPTKWNWQRLDQLKKEVSALQTRIHTRMRRMEQMINKAS